MAIPPSTKLLGILAIYVMSLQDKINQALEQLRPEVATKVMSSSKKEYEIMVTKLISDVYKTGDTEKIERFTEKLDELRKYTESEMGIKKLSFKEYKGHLRERRENLTKILMSYPEEKVRLSELAEKSGFNIKQLAGYTHGKNPLLVRDGEFYKVGKILKKK